MKPSIKLTFWYEFLLRFVSHSVGGNIFVIPKIGYVHGLGRKGSLLEHYRETVQKEESEFWIKTAKKESFFKEERAVEYKPKAK